MSVPFPSTAFIDESRDWFFTVTWTDSNGNPISLTGATASMAFGPDYDQTPYLTVTSAGGQITFPSTGTIAVHVTAAQNVIPAGMVASELVVTLSGVQYPIVKGKLPCIGKVVTP